MNTKKFFIGRGIGFIVVLILAAGYFALTGSKPDTQEISKVDYKNATYTIENEPVTLVGGFAETEIAPGSASKQTTQFFGNEAEGDLNGDGKPDVAFVLWQSGNGTGTFYYIVAALGGDKGYQGLNGVLLGDRIAPQSTQIRDGRVIVNYAERRPEEPFTASPSVGVSKYLKVSGGKLVEVK